MPLHACHISTFSPTQCGIATFAEDLIHHQHVVSPVRVRLIYRDEVAQQDSCQFRIRLQELEDYKRAAAELNGSGIDVISLQHEFGIFGGPDGEHVLELVRRLRVPIVATLHTVYARMTPGKERVLRALAMLCEHLVVLTEEGKKSLVSSFGVPASKITVIHHGIPNVKFSLPEESPIRKALGSGPVFISAGHIKPKKGFEVALRALTKFRQDHPSFKYLIVGSSQPQFDRENSYEALLKRYIQEEELGHHVVRINKYLVRDDFIATIQAADIGLVTYTMASQNSSGILPLILGCGRPVVTTDFEFARSVASRVAGVLLAKDNDPDAVHELLCELVENSERTRELMSRTHCSTRQWLWSIAADLYVRTYQSVVGASTK